MFSPTDPLTLAALFVVAFVASVVDAIAGGGGLLTLPCLLLAGVDPLSALATNKVQSSCGSVSATYVFARRGLLEWPRSLAFVGCAFVAAIAGAASVSVVPRAVLAAIVPLVLIGVAVYFLLVPTPSAMDARARVPFAVFAAGFVSVIGFYDGIFGPGTGSFLTIGFVVLLGYGLVRATAHTKLANAASNLGALACFALTGKIVWPIGCAMGIGALVGGQVGSRLAIRHGARLIRPLLVTISCAMAIRLLLDPANPLRKVFAATLSMVLR